MAAVNPIIRDRIIASAEALYNAGDKTKLPSVGAVRRHSNASMTDTCAVMKDWRRLQTTPASAPTVDIPDRVLQASNDLLRELWKEAQKNAGDSLLLAQVAWDKERAGMLQMSDEVNADCRISQLGTG